MLRVALVYEKVFLRFAEEDASYVVNLAYEGGLRHPMKMIGIR